MAISDISTEAKLFTGAAEAAARSVKTLAERAFALEKFLAENEKIGQGEHGA